jgi:hypothetical protein
MTTLIEAARQALEALEDACGGRCNAEYNPCFQREAITSLRQAIEQAEQQEPYKFAMEVECNNCGTKQSGIITFTPPPRQWVGLTPEEVKHQWEVWRANAPRYIGFAKGIEEKLKEKNT